MRPSKQPRKHQQPTTPNGTTRKGEKLGMSISRLARRLASGSKINFQHVSDTLRATPLVECVHGSYSPNHGGQILATYCRTPPSIHHVVERPVRLIRLHSYDRRRRPKPGWSGLGNISHRSSKTTGKHHVIEISICAHYIYICAPAYCTAGTLSLE